MAAVRRRAVGNSAAGRGVGVVGTRRRGLRVTMLGTGSAAVVAAAVAVPEAFGTGEAGDDSSTQSDLTNVVASARTVFTDSGGHFPTQPSLVNELSQAEPELAVIDSPVTNVPPHSVLVVVSPDENVILAVAQSADQRCWFIEDNEEPQPGSPVPTDWSSQLGSSYGVTTAASGPFADCSSSFVPFLTAPDFTGWSRSWPS